MVPPSEWMQCLWHAPLSTTSFQQQLVSSPQKAIQAELALLRIELVGLILLDELLGAGGIRIRVEDLVQAGITLCLVQELHQLSDGHALALRVANADEKHESKRVCSGMATAKSSPYIIDVLFNI